MKKVFIIFCLFFMSFLSFSQDIKIKENYKYPRLDLDFRFYLPTILGHVTGRNPYLCMREDIDAVDSCTNFMIETRGTVATVKNITFAVSFGGGGYVENNKDKDTNLSSVNLSLGAGMYLHLFKSPTYPLNGLCFFLYPVYQIPVYTENHEPYLKWKTAIDVGYTFTLIDSITIYPYVRNIFAWNSKEFRYGFDCGVSIGFYIHDNAYEPYINYKETPEI